MARRSRRRIGPGHVVGEYLELGTEKGDPGRPRVCAILAAWEKSGKLEVYIERTTPSAKARKYLRPSQQQPKKTVAAG